MPDEQQRSSGYRGDQGSSGSSSSYSQQFGGSADGEGFEPEEARASPWDPSPYYPSEPSRQQPHLPPPLPPPPGLVYAPPSLPQPQPSSHHDFLLDLMHRSNNFYPQPTSSSSQFAVPPQLPPPPVPLPRREPDPLQDYTRYRPVGSSTSPLGDLGPERNPRGSSSYRQLAGNSMFDSINLQHPYPYSPTQPQSASSSSSYFPSQAGTGSNFSPYNYSGHLPPAPSNVLHPLPHPLHYQHQSPPQTSISTPVLWSNSFPRDGPRPPSPPTSRESAEGHPSSFPYPPPRTHRGNSSPSIWEALDAEPGPSTSSRPQSSRARSSSTVERSGSASAGGAGGGRKKLPAAATKTLLTWFDNSRDKYPSKDQKAEWERTTGLTLQQIDDWFINKRRRVKNVALSQSQQHGNEGRR